MISEWRQVGYRIELLYITLSHADLAVARVRQRVMVGGHNIPENVIRRRFEFGLQNFHAIYKVLVDSWYFYDNSGDGYIPLDSGGKA